MNVNVTENIISNNVFTLEKDKIIDSNNSYEISKRIVEIIISVMALVLLSPIYLFIALAIKIDSKGPIIFKHKRIGKNGKIIYIYKFRTMVENAESLIKYFTPEQLEKYKENFKLEDDPRITTVGKILRKTSLDELPQFLNIIKGELSIIGPRPVVEEELERYGKNKEKFLSVTPGLTGYWAANGRSCTSYKERMKMELYYVDNASWKLDTKIFLKTIALVLKREGAM